MWKKLLCLLAVVTSLCIIAPQVRAQDRSVFGPADYTISRWHVMISRRVFHLKSPGKAVLVATKNTPRRKILKGFVLLNHRLISLHRFLRGDETTVSKGCSLRHRNSLMILLVGTPRASITIAIRKSGGPVKAPQIAFSADPVSIGEGDSATLSWQTSGADGVAIDNGVGSAASSGSTVVTPSVTTTYTLTATGPGGVSTAAATVTVRPKPAVSLSAAPTSVRAGGSTTLTWTSANADQCDIEPGIGGVDPSGATNVSLTATTTYTITASGPGGTSTAAVTVNAFQPPTVSFTANPATITLGQPTTLSWTTTGADSAVIDQGSGNVPASGTITVSPNHSTTYSITVIGRGGTAGAQTRVTVNAAVLPQPDGSFGQRYQDLVPPDATIGNYASRRFALITGLIRDVSGQPIAGVSVTVLDHAEYGTATTDDKGRYSMPVEGGGTPTLVYQKQGLIPIHRQVKAPWKDIAVAETATMIAPDPAATTVTFDGNPNTVVTHRSTTVTDEFGSRSATMVFTGDNHAWLLDENGNDVKEMNAVTVRATEFSTPAAMPAKLPPASAFTYCAELSVDGAQRVRFDKPVVTWVNNFLGFKVGTIVPVGYYDRDHGVWVPSDNGVVVRLLDTNGDGITDALDADGDGHSDDLNGDGSFSDEAKGLTAPDVYPPGTTFFRFMVHHFCGYDSNYPYGPLFISNNDYDMFPNPDGNPTVDQQLNKDDETKTCPASFVEDKGRIFHEDISVPGTDITLHYASNRVAGYQTVISVPASGDSFPPSVSSYLTSIVVKVEVAGRQFEQVLPPLPDQKAEFIWNGLDYLGRPVIGSIVAHISVGFEYDNAYYYTQPSTRIIRAFGYPGEDVVSNVPARQPECYLWKYSELDILKEYNGDKKENIAEGWTLSPHHQLSPINPDVLNRGDGSFIKNSIRIIDTVAGNGIVGFGQCNDGGPFMSAAISAVNELPGDNNGNPPATGSCGDGVTATDASIWSPNEVAVDTAGNLIIADTGNNRIRKVDTEGVITTIAGNGVAGFWGDNGPAVDSSLDSPYAVSADSAGNLFIADTYNNRIRKVDPNGIITTVAGNGAAGFGGDNGPATNAELNEPYSVAVDTFGNLYIADTGNKRIRKVDPSGIITTVAGNGTAGFSGDGGAATHAELRAAGNIAVDNSGNLYIADTGNGRIRKVDPSGIITTVAGNGTAGFGGDNGPAVNASLDAPRGLAVDRVGNLFIADSNNQCIRMVAANGIISTIAGRNRNWGYYGDGGPVLYATLHGPSGVAVDGAGNLFIADSVNQRIREISTPGIFRSSMTNGDIPFADNDSLGYITSGTGIHKATIDLETGVTLRKFGYDNSNRLISITDQFGNQTTINRYGDGTPASITSPYGHTTQLTIDADNHLTRITYPDGSHYDFQYTTDGLLTAKTEPDGNQFKHQFDASGRLTDASDDEGGRWQYTRTTQANGDVLSQVLTGMGNLTTSLDHTDYMGYSSTITDPTGAQTLFNRTNDGLSATKSLPCGMDLDFKYDLDPQYKFKFIKEIIETTPAGLTRDTLKNTTYQDTDGDNVPDLITETVAVNGKPTTVKNNVLQSEKRVTSPEGRTVTLDYDPATLLIKSVSVPGLFDTTYGYDARGRLTSTRINTRQTRFAYDTDGNLASVTGPQGYTTSYGYDALGRLTAVYRPDGGNLFFTYDKNGNMIVLTNPSDVSFGFGYNGVNLRDSYQTPLSGTYSYVYDADRRLIQTTFPSGKQINNVYDDTRFSEIQTPQGNIDFTYLCTSKIGSITSGSQSITYGYDGKLLTSETFAGTLNQSLSYSYDNDFDVTSLSYAGSTDSYGYDNDGLLTSAGPFTIARDSGNGLPETVSGAAVAIDRGFSGYGELDSQNMTVAGSPVIQWNLNRDNAGRITAETETVAGVTSHYAYTYDTMGRLKTVTKDGAQVESYIYDLDGTRISATNTLRGITDRHFSYSDEDHLLTAGSATYQYDADGFLSTKTDGAGVTAYHYSLRGELLQVNLPDGRVVTYDHDPLGRRIAKRINGTIVKKYLWQGMTRLLAVYDGAGNLIQRFEYADTRMPVVMTQGGVTYYLAYDQVGSLRAVSDGSGNIIKRIDYDAFGNVIDDTNSAFTVPLGFAGGLYDRDTGLVRFGYRDYDPDTGRWTEKDPIGFAGGDTDLYGYVQGDPVNSLDSRGLCVAQIVGAFLGGGLNAYNNYSAYKSGKMSGLSYAKSIAFGAGTGLLSSFGGPIIGALLSSLNNFNEQLLNDSPCEGINWNDIGRTFATGLSVGLIAKGATKAGSLLINVPTQIGSLIGSKAAQVSSYGPAFSITANITGSILTN